MTVSPQSWHPSAAYLYVLHLDARALAWEYLRRHPDYRGDWRRHRRRSGAVPERWGLLALEDPALDARDAQPAWHPEPAGVVQLHPDLVPPPDASPFDLWQIDGHKHLIHEGQHLALTTSAPGRWRRYALAPILVQGMPYVCAVHSDDSEMPFLVDERAPWAHSVARPGRATLLEAHTLRALDGMLAGATLREVGEVVYGPAAVADDWHADSALRARVRRLTQRGAGLMRGGYRRLLHAAPTVQGRSRRRAKRP